MAGALFDISLAFPLCVLMNTVGAYTCYLVSKLFLKEVVENQLKDKVKMLTSKLEEHRDDLFFYMVFLRVFPGSPNWLMNISFAHMDTISAFKLVLSVFFGLMPWNFITCSGGKLIATIQSKADIVKPETYIQLISIAFLSLLPILIKKVFFNNYGKEEKHAP